MNAFWLAYSFVSVQDWITAGTTVLYVLEQWRLDFIYMMLYLAVNIYILYIQPESTDTLFNKRRIKATFLHSLIYKAIQYS